MFNTTYYILFEKTYIKNWPKNKKKMIIQSSTFPFSWFLKVCTTDLVSWMFNRIYYIIFMYWMYLVVWSFFGLWLNYWYMFSGEYYPKENKSVRIHQFILNQGPCWPFFWNTMDPSKHVMIFILRLHISSSNIQYFA